MKKKLLIITLLLTFFGCTTRSEILQSNARHYFRSTKSPGALAVCIDRNADDSFANALKSKITNVAGQPVEVLIREGQVIAVVVQIEAVDGGSKAVFYLGSFRSLIPGDIFIDLTNGCE